MKKTLFTLLAVFICLSASAVNDTLSVYKATSLPKIDGVLSEWTGTWTPLTKTKVTASGHNNASAKFQAKYTKDSLYVAVQVLDSTVSYSSSTISNTYERDCVELFIKMDTTTNTSNNGADQYRLIRDGSFAAGDGATVTSIGKQKVAPILGADGTTVIGWNAELSFAWYGTATSLAAKNSFTQSIAGIDNKPYPFIRFEVGVANNTTGSAGGRTQQLFWNSNADTQYNSMAAQGFAKLKGNAPIGSNKVTDIYKTKTAPNVSDGLVSDWTGTWVPLSLKKINAVSGHNNASAKFQAAYTNDSLYVAIQVLDSTPNFASAITNNYERDCAEVFVKLDTTTVTSNSGADQYRLVRDGSFSFGNGTATALGKQKATPVLGADGTTVIGWNSEWSFAWFGTASLAAKNSYTQPTAGIDNKPYPFIRFEIDVANNTTGATGGRTEQLFWNSAADTQYNTMATQGYATLINTLGPITEVPTITKSTAKVYYTASGLTVSGYTGNVNVYNVVGKLILTSKVNSNNQVINLSSLNKGVYIVTGSGFSTKFIK